MDEHPEIEERTRVELALIAQRAGVTFSEDEILALAPKVAHNRAALEELRAAIQLEEEPAHTFAKQVGRGRL